jgi:hypothetical protein
MSLLTEDQRQFVIIQARTAGGAQAVLELLQRMGFNTSATVGVLVTALTAAIEAGYDGDQRLEILNGLLADTARQWSEGCGLRIVQ